MTRRRLSLDGLWDFQFDADGGLSAGQIMSWRKAVVPGPWQAQFDDLRQKTGVGWYRRTFLAPAGWIGPAVILHLGAVNYHARVWLNGAYLGEHEGGYLPFEYEVGEQLRAGARNELLVRVLLPGDDPKKYPDFPFAEIPHGKQSWYGLLGGIWQSVWLERRSPCHVQAMRLQPDLRTGQIKVHLALSKPAAESCRLRARLLAPAGEVAATAEVGVAAGVGRLDFVMVTDNPLPWSPEHPHLYQLEIELVRGDVVRDATVARLGFRSIAAREGKLFLNGRPLYLRAALDQDYYPGSISTPPSPAFLEDQFRKAKEMGFNCLRCHIKVPHPRYYEIADRLGMLVWAELPSWRTFTDKAAQRARATLQGMVERDGHHPSIIAWTIINESWGLDLVHDPEHRAWLQETYRWLKELDPTRLVVDNSPTWPNFHIQSDLEDYHHYRALPDHRRQWDAFVSAFAGRPSWTFSPHGDAVRSGHEPLIVSEFGNWGLPDANDLQDEQGREPWWFETGHEWGRGVAYPHGVQQRFRTWRLDRVFGSWRACVEATQWQQYQALKYEIESIRRHPQISGYVITELTDVYWECNGLMDMRRRPRVFHTQLARINADLVIIPQWQRVAYWSGEQVQVTIQIAGDVQPHGEDCLLRWRLMPGDIGGHFMVSDMHVAHDIIFPAPQVAAPGQQRLVLELCHAGGRVLASNDVTLTIFPRRDAPEAALRVPLWTPQSRLAERLDALGYPLASGPETAGAVVADQLDDALLAYVRGGGRLLLLAEGADALGPGFPGVRLIPGEEAIPGHGDWISSFAWLRRQGPFVRFPGGPLLDFAFERIMPQNVLEGFAPLDFEANVYAGIFVGWIHDVAALVAVRSYGRGRAVFSTFRLTTDAPGAEPTATTFLDALIKLTLG